MCRTFWKDNDEYGLESEEGCEEPLPSPVPLGQLYVQVLIVAQHLGNLWRTRFKL